MKHGFFLTLILLLSIAAFGQLPERHITNNVTGITVHSDSLEISDVVFTYFQDADGKYLTGMQDVKDFRYLVNGFTITSFNNNQPDYPSGNPIGDVIYLGVLRNGQLYKFSPDQVTQGYTQQQVDAITAQSMVLYIGDGFKITGDLSGPIKQVPYLTWLYKQCPSLYKTIIDAGQVAIGDEVIINQFIPQYCESYSLDVTTGFGTLIRDGKYSWIYTVAKGDPDLGEVGILVSADSYAGCANDQALFNCKILLEPEVTGATYPGLTDSQFRLYMKYYFDVNKQGNDLVACYERKRSSWPDKPLPNLRIELYTSTSKYRPAKLAETRTPNSDYPCETFKVSQGVTGYIKAIAVNHGYFEIYRF